MICTPSLKEVSQCRALGEVTYSMTSPASRKTDQHTRILELVKRSRQYRSSPLNLSRATQLPTNQARTIVTLGLAAVQRVNRLDYLTLRLTGLRDYSVGSCMKVRLRTVIFSHYMGVFRSS